MRTVLGILLLLGLAGCGSGQEQVDAAGTPPSGAKPRLVTLVSQPDVGGGVDPRARSLAEPDDVAAFTESFTDDRMRVALGRALAEVDVPEGLVAAGAVVAVGCRPPTDVDIEVDRETSGVLVTAPAEKAGVQCLLPVTTVAVVGVAPGSL